MPIGTTDITFSGIQTEYGGSNPIDLSEYYKGGSFVPTAPPNGTTTLDGVTYVVSNSTVSIPTSGAISIDNFKNTAKVTTITVTVTSNQTNFNLLSAIYAALGSFTAGIICTCTINSGVVVYSTSTGTPAFSTGSFPAGSTLSIVNNGYIIGMGGGGGAGGSFNNGAGGGGAGPALNLNIATTINNLGYIWGGGGGGGGGGSAGYSGGTYYSGGGGGGGGQSYQDSPAAAAGGQVNLYTQFQAPANGGNGTSAGGGAGGVGGQQGEDITGKGKPPPVTRYIYGQGGNGGAGGSFGAAGTAGGNGTAPSPGLFTFLYNGGAAGAGGYYLIANGNAATWTNFGNRLGTEV